MALVRSLFLLVLVTLSVGNFQLKAMMRALQSDLSRLSDSLDMLNIRLRPQRSQEVILSELENLRKNYLSKHDIPYDIFKRYGLLFAELSAVPNVSEDQLNFYAYHGADAGLTYIDNVIKPINLKREEFLQKVEAYTGEPMSMLDALNLYYGLLEAFEDNQLLTDKHYKQKLKSHQDVLANLALDKSIKNILKYFNDKTMQFEGYRPYLKVSGPQPPSSQEPFKREDFEEFKRAYGILSVIGLDNPRYKDLILKLDLPRWNMVLQNTVGKPPRTPLLKPPAKKSRPKAPLPACPAVTVEQDRKLLQQALKNYRADPNSISVEQAQQLVTLFQHYKELLEALQQRVPEPRLAAFYHEMLERAKGR